MLGNELPVETNLPTTGRIGVMDQPREKRYVAHLLYSPTSTRGKMRDLPIELIEDVIPLRDTRVALRLKKKVKTVRLVPDGEALGFNQEDGVVSFTVPEFASHQMVELGNYPRGSLGWAEPCRFPHFPDVGCALAGHVAYRRNHSRNRNHAGTATPAHP